MHDDDDAKIRRKIRRTITMTSARTDRPSAGSTTASG